MQYFATFLTGFGNIVSKQLKFQIPDAKISILLDGLVFFETITDPNVLQNLPFLNNTFNALSVLKDVKNFRIDQLIDDLVRQIDPALIEQHQTFSLVFSKENQTTKLPSQVFDILRQEIGKKIHGSFAPDGKLEIWIIERREGFIFLGIRVRGGEKPYLEKGQLRPELSFLMVSLAEPAENDVFLDPFAGSGAIPIEVAKHFSVQKILAGDIDSKLSENLKNQLEKSELPVTVGKWNALEMEKFEDESIDKIVTDPPWGLFHGENLDLQKFYAQMFKEFYRILKPGGLIVILISNKDLIEKLVRETKRFELLAQFNTLVNGQKAAVFKLKKH